METDQIEQLLACEPLMCHYTGTATDELPEIVETYPFVLVYNTHNADQPGENWVAMYVEEIGDYFDPYGHAPQHFEFTNFMNDIAQSDRLKIVHYRALHLPFVGSTASFS